jgi:uncharacterized membrane protein
MISLSGGERRDVVDTYELLLFLHVLGAALWAGGAVIYYVLVERMNVASDRQALSGLLSHSEKVGQFYFMPAALVTLIAGIFLVLRGDWRWSEPFVIVGLVGVAITVVVGAILSTPREKALEEALSSPNSSYDDVRRAFGPVRAIARLDVLLLVVIIFFMTVKPGT